MIKVNIEKGYYEFKLEDLLKKKNIDIKTLPLLQMVYLFMKKV